MAWPRRDVWVAGVMVMLVAGAGGTLTDIGPWYRGLAQPSWQPPDWLFGPVWTAIYTLSAIAGVTAWRAAKGAAARAFLLGVFLLNGVLNVLWSGLFFYARRPDWALLESGALWLSVLALMLVTRRHSTVAPWFLLPYLIWVAFAAVLNLAVVRLNGPFG